MPRSATDPAQTGLLPTVHKGLIASGDRFIATAQIASHVREALRADDMEALAIEMEGAARTISDRADDLAHVDFAQFLTEIVGVYSQRILAHFLTLPAIEHL